MGAGSFTRDAASVLGHPLVSAVTARATASRPRIVAYHDVPDAAAFRRQLEMLVEHYRPVDEAAIVAAVIAGRRLDPRSLWITFDDGFPGVLERAQPIMDELDIRGTIYVCPGLLDTDRPMWWEIIEEAQRQGVGTSMALIDVKRLPDTERRELVADSEAKLDKKLGRPYRRPQITLDALRSWVAAGHSVGNHSWDHPCLDACSAEEQERQVYDTHAWLVDVLGVAQPTFAYPNGNRSDATEKALRRLNYPVALLFDHRLADLRADPLRMSRLRLSADASVERARSIVSGAHPLAFGAAGKIRRTG